MTDVTLVYNYSATQISLEGLWVGLGCIVFVVVRRTARLIMHLRDPKYLLSGGYKRRNSDSQESFTKKQYRFSDDNSIFGCTLAQSLDAIAQDVIVIIPDNGEPLELRGRLPLVVAACGQYLTQQDRLKTEGIFRRAGNSRRVKELQDAFSEPDSDLGRNFNNWDQYTVHDVATLLKRYLNNLPQPLIEMQYDEDTVNKVLFSSADPTLDYDQQVLLWYLLGLLRLVAMHSEDNLMPATNLAVIFQPAILRPESTGPHSLEQARLLVEQLITRPGEFSQVHVLATSSKAISPKSRSRRSTQYQGSLGSSPSRQSWLGRGLALASPTRLIRQDG